MKCNMKYLFKVAGAVVAVLAIAYVALPQFHAEILAVAPLAAVMLCPLSMLLMVWFMQRPVESASAVVPQARKLLPASESRSNRLSPSTRSELDFVCVGIASTARNTDSLS
jgi:hypothetical protein